MHSPLSSPPLPSLICQLRLSAQAQRALALFEHQRSDPLPFFFFDFDGTLTLADGCTSLHLLHAIAVRQRPPTAFAYLPLSHSLAYRLLQLHGGSLERLFGGAERRRALQSLLIPLLEAGQCYVLTANAVLKRVEDALNALLASGGAKGRSVRSRFSMGGLDPTLRYVPRGDKLREIEAILAARSLVLVGGSIK